MGGEGDGVEEDMSWTTETEANWHGEIKQKSGDEGPAPSL